MRPSGAGFLFLQPEPSGAKQHPGASWHLGEQWPSEVPVCGHAHNTHPSPPGARAPPRSQPPHPGLASCLPAPGQWLCRGTRATGAGSTPHAAPELRWEMPMANQSVRAKGCAARVKPDTGGQAPCDRVSPAAGRGLAVPPGPPAPNDGVAGLAWKVPSAKRKRPTRRQAPWNRQAIWGRCRRPEVFRPI